MPQNRTQILDFWFKDLTPQQWFGGGLELDDLVQKKFSVHLEAAKKGDCDHWTATPRGRLALILLLDQFSRHIFRATDEAYAADKKA